MMMTMSDEMYDVEDVVKKILKSMKVNIERISCVYCYRQEWIGSGWLIYIRLREMRGPERGLLPASSFYTS
jgi:hypothetical protein